MFPVKESIAYFSEFDQSQRKFFLQDLVECLDKSELLSLSSNINPKLRKDIISDLPVELRRHLCNNYLKAEELLGFCQVSKKWNFLLSDAAIWKSFGKFDDVQNVSNKIQFINKQRILSKWLDKKQNQCIQISPENLSRISTFINNPIGGGKYIKTRLSEIQIESMSYEGTAIFRNLNPVNDFKILHANPNLLTIDCHRGQTVTCVEADDDYIITGSSDGTINVWCKNGQNQRTKRSSNSPTLSNSFVDLQNVLEKSAENYLKMGFSLKGTLSGHRGQIWTISYFDHFLVSGCTKSQIKIWSLKTMDCIETHVAHLGTVRCLAFFKNINENPSRKFNFVSGSRDKTLRWFFPTARKTPEIEKKSSRCSSWDSIQLKQHTGHIRSVIWSPCGNRIISGSYDSDIIIWYLSKTEQNTISGHIILKGHSRKIYSLEISKCGRFLISGGLDPFIIVWEMPERNNDAMDNDDQINGFQIAHRKINLSSNRRRSRTLLTETEFPGPHLVTGLILLQSRAFSKKTIRIDRNSNSIIPGPKRNLIIAAENLAKVSIFDLQTGQLLNRIDTTNNQNNNRSYHDDNNLEVASALDQIRRGFENLTRELGHQDFDADGMLQNVTVNRNQNLNASSNSDSNPPSNFTITSIDYVTCPYNINYKSNSKSPQNNPNLLLVVGLSNGIIKLFDAVSGAFIRNLVDFSVVKNSAIWQVKVFGENGKNLVCTSGTNMQRGPVRGETEVAETRMGLLDFG